MDDDQAGGYYNLYINGSKFATVAGTSFTIPASPSASGVSYTMNVTSAGAIGNDQSDQNAPVKFTYLSAPSGVTAVQVASGVANYGGWVDTTVTGGGSASAASRRLRSWARSTVWSRQAGIHEGRWPTS